MYVRGDANASYTPRNNNKRDAVFQHFCVENLLQPVPLNHKTYHHFQGAGVSDSSIDVLLFSSTTGDGTPAANQENLTQILCCKSDPRIFNSHHDAIISSFDISFCEAPSSEHSPVPSVENTRYKVIWNDDSLEAYSDLVSPVLADLRETWLDPTSPSSISILLQQTNNILSSAAKATQKCVDLGAQHKSKKMKIPENIQAASKILQKHNEDLTKLLEAPSCSSINVENAKLAVAKS